MWVPILEKAYAKAYGSYKAIEAGNIDEAMRDLTGSPSFSFEISEKSEDELWKVIKRCFEKKFVLSCAVDIDDEEESDQIPYFYYAMTIYI